MPNPIKAFKGGVRGVQIKSMAIKMDNQAAKSGQLASATGAAPAKKQVMTPLTAAKAFVNGASKPAKAKTTLADLKGFGGKKPGTK